MSLLDILTYPDEFLKTITQPVKNIDGNLQELFNNMAETMYAAPGVGLAATQVGIDQSFLLYDLAPQGEEQSLNILVNPVIVSREGEILSENEGCLSVPDYRADVKRAERVLVEAYDRDGNPLRIEAEGMHAIVLQHEIDHLNGTLFINHISRLKRQLFERKIQKRLRQQ
ncbi:MAG: peptide deformylase [Desulfosarcinaceae bacterium]